MGAPGVVNGRLAGVVSFGSPSCGSPDTPTVFTQLGYYSDWIDEIMDMVWFSLFSINDIPVIWRRRNTSNFNDN